MVFPNHEDASQKVDNLLHDWPDFVFQNYILQDQIKYLKNFLQKSELLS